MPHLMKITKAKRRRPQRKQRDGFHYRERDVPADILERERRDERRLSRVLRDEDGDDYAF